MAQRISRQHTTVDSFVALVASIVVMAGCGSASRPAGAVSTSASPTAPSVQVCPPQRVDTDAALRALASCTAVDGDLVVRRTNVTALRSLSRLKSVRGRLQISENVHLRSLDGLEKLEHVGELVLAGNPSLTRLSALGRLSRARGVGLVDLQALESTVGLEKLEALDSLVVLRTGVSTLRGLDGLRRVRHVRLEQNWQLVSVRQLSGITRAETIEVRNNPLLYGGPEEFFPRLTRVQQIVVTGNGAISPREAESFSGRVALSQPTAAERER